MNLFINLYKTHNHIRQKEIDYCLKRNLDNPLIDVYVMNEGVPLPSHINQKFVTKRPTYNDMFKWANEIGGISIIANNDIYFDESIGKAGNILDGECYALTRYNVGGGLECKSGGSQDVWIFKGEIKVDAPFNLGVLGCDNRVAYEIDKAGYFVTNPAKDIITYHYHQSNHRTYSKADTIPPPYKIIPITGQYQKKKVLHFALAPDQTAMEKALRTFGEYKSIVWPLQDNPADELLKVCKEWKPDFIFAQIQRGRIISERTAHLVKEMGIPLYNWTGDVRAPLPQWYKDIGKYCTTLFSNMTDVKEMRAEGLDAQYLQTGIDELQFNPFRGKIDNTPDIVFMANNYPDAFPLSSYRLQVAVALKEKYGDKFGLYGRGWPKELQARNINGNWEREAQIYSSCKIAINISHFNYSRYSSDRLFRAMGSGAFVLSHYFEDLEKDYTPAMFKTFHDIPDLISKISRYLANDEQREQVAINGCLHVRKHCTWYHRMLELRTIINNSNGVDK